MRLEKKEKKQGDEKEEKINQIKLFTVFTSNRDRPNMWGCYVFGFFFFCKTQEIHQDICVGMCELLSILDYMF